MPERHYDVVIVGSGFGGSVLAYRLATAGLRVCVLERGKAYPPNSFARAPFEMRQNFWDPSEGLYGLNNVWAFKGASALVASGLGGGSLIYANVLIRKDPKWFESWPITYADLDPHYGRVERMMDVQQYPIHLAPYNQTDKTNAFRQAAQSLGHQPIDLNLAISFRTAPGNSPAVGEPIIESQPNLHGKTRYTCRLCGECDIGCNYGSKNTLDFTYLSEAKRAGAHIRTLSQVDTFRPRPNGKGYEVTFIAHHPDHPRRRDPATGKPHRERITISCHRLILSAGSIGTTFLLLSNKANFPNLSPAVGTNFSTNGDELAFFTNAKKPLRPDYGPVITTGIRYPDTLDGNGDVGRGFYIEDGGNPYLADWIVELAGIGGFARRTLRFLGFSLLNSLGLARKKDMGFRFAKLLGPCTRSSHAMPVLAMGRDVPGGRFTLQDGVLDCSWTEKDSDQYFERLIGELKKLAKAMDAQYVNNPVWQFDFKNVLTAHPLGGCPMGTNIEVGVVDNWGQVFGHPGLYIADGSVMPGPVGPNPSLTIAAFADRVADGILARPVP